jgi:cytochrome P450
MIAERRRSGEDRGDLLSMLLHARDVEGDGQGMDDRQIRDEMMTLFLAGHETTANALAWTWCLLAQNPDAEAHLHDAIGRVLDDRPAGRRTFRASRTSSRWWPNPCVSTRPPGPSAGGRSRTTSSAGSGCPPAPSSC